MSGSGKRDSLLPGVACPTPPLSTVFLLALCPHRILSPVFYTPSCPPFLTLNSWLSIFSLGALPPAITIISEVLLCVLCCLPLQGPSEDLGHVSPASGVWVAGAAHLPTHPKEECSGVT